MSKSEKVLLDKSLVVKLVKMANAHTAEKRELLAMVTDILEKMIHGPAVAVLSYNYPMGREHLVFDTFEKAVAKAEKILKNEGVDIEHVDITNYNKYATHYQWDDDTKTVLVAMMDIE